MKRFLREENIAKSYSMIIFPLLSKTLLDAG